VFETERLCLAYNSLLHLLLKNCDFLNTDISQGSVETGLWCGGVFVHDCYKFPTGSNSERILKIGKYLSQHIQHDEVGNT